MQKKFLFIACFFLPIICFTQQYPFVHYSPKDGLVNSRVRKAYQDSRGIMYLMTYGGLSVYDGARFTNYTKQNGLAADMINDVIEMGEDSLWIACNTVGLNYLKNGKIRSFKTSDGFCPIINKIIRCEDGEVYVIADEGLFRFQKDKFVRQVFKNRRGADAGKFLIDAAEWNNLLLIVADIGLSSLGPGNFFAFDKATGKLHAESENGYISSISISPDNQLFTTDASGRLHVIDTTSLRNKRVRLLSPPVIFRGVDAGISTIYFDEKKNCWLLFPHKKIIKVEPAGTITRFSMENGLSSSDFSDIMIDREGSAWITMNSSGIDKLVNDKIERYDKFRDELVNSLYADENTDSVIIYSISGNKMFIIERDRIREQPLHGRHVITGALMVASGKIYAPDLRDLILLSEDKKGTNKVILTDTSQLSLGYIYQDPYKNLLGVGSSHFTTIIDDSIVFRYPVSTSIDQVAFDRKGRVWAASRNNDFFVLRIDPNNREQYLQLLKRFDKDMPELSARSLTVDQRDNVWVGTRYDGLYWFRFDEQLNIDSIRHLTIRDGLSDNFITHLTCDSDNNIWASTASGIDKITYDSNKINIENITRSHNIYEHILKTFVGKDGIAWSYTADGGLIKIGRNKYSSTFRPRLFITGLKIGNTTADSLEHSFSYKQNSLSVSVAAPSFYDERQIKYSYLLEGSGNDQWSDPTTTTVFNFINLKPGKYNLKIKAAFPGNRYPEQMIAYSFFIHPPWWQTWWFRILGGSVAITLLIVGVRYYYRRKLEKQKMLAEKQQAVEKERTRIATDIHDDLGSGLSRIRYLGEMVRLKSSQRQNILPDIEKISVFSDEMVDKMNEIVWALNEKNDSLEAIISYMRSFAVEYLSNNDLYCTINIPDEVPFRIIKGETRRNIFLSVKESLHNIVKHSAAKKVEISVSIDGGLHVVIHDNGKGIEWEKVRPFSNGITNIKKRMAEAGGAAEFRNENGTTVVLRIPL